MVSFDRELNKKEFTVPVLNFDSWVEIVEKRHKDVKTSRKEIHWKTLILTQESKLKTWCDKFFFAQGAIEWDQPGQNPVELCGTNPPPPDSKTPFGEKFESPIIRPGSYNTTWAWESLF